MGNIIDNANAVDPGMTVQQVALVVLIVGLACFITARWVIWYLTRNIKEPLPPRRYRIVHEQPDYSAWGASDTDDIDEETALIARDMMDEDDDAFYRRVYR